MKQYIMDLEFYRKHLLKGILEVSSQDLQNYLMHLKMEHRYENASLTRKVAFLRSFYGFLHEQKILPFNPAKPIKFPKVRDKPIPFLSEEAVQKILSVISYNRDQLIIKVAFYEGLRREEIVKLRRGDIDFGNRTILINGKGNKQRIIPLHDELYSELYEYTRSLTSDDYLFPLVPRMINEIVEKYSKQVGIRCYPHLLRHSFAANLYKRTKNLWLISKMLGHSKLETTVKYLRSLNVLDDFSAEYQKAFSGILNNNAERIRLGYGCSANSI